MIQSVSNQTQSLTNQQSSTNYMFVGPYRLEKTLGKGQTGTREQKLIYFLCFNIYL